VDKEHEGDLENPANWDFAHITMPVPVKSTRVVVSVSFRPEDFNAVAGQAERSGKKVSEFIREAALNEATGRNSNTVIYAFGSTGSIWFGDSFPSTTRVQSNAIKRIMSEPVVTYN
jgi:hypothetical protein